MAEKKNAVSSFQKLMEEGKALYDKALYKEAVKTFKTAQVMSSKLDKFQLGSLYIWLGNSYYNLKDNDKYRYYYELYLKEYPEGQASVFSRLAHAYYYIDVDKSIDYHTSRGKDTPAEGKEQENKSISGEKASQPNMKRLNISPSESLSEERTMTSPFIPPDIEEIAHETITTPEAIGPTTEKNALQDALQDEEALSQESSASASSSGEKKKENFLDKITKKIFTSPMSPPTEEEEKHD